MFVLKRTSPESRKYFLKINLLLFAFLLLSIFFNKEYLRPEYGQVAFLGVILGSYPNFIASYFISIFALGFALNQEAKIRRKFFYSISLLVFLLMTCEELFPWWGVSKTCDPFDILANGAGLLLAISTFEYFVSKR